MDKYSFELSNLKLSKMLTEPGKVVFFSNNPLTLDQANEIMSLVKSVLNTVGGNLNQPHEGRVSMNWWDGRVILEKIPVHSAYEDENFDQDPFDDDEED